MQFEERKPKKKLHKIVTSVNADCRGDMTPSQQ